MTLPVALINLMLLLAGILFFLLPEMSRPGTLFGVTVATEFPESREGRRILGQFRRRIAFATFFIIALSNAMMILISNQALPFAVLLVLTAAITCWVYASRATRAFAQTVPSVRAASLTPRSRSLPGGWLFFSGPFLILALAAWFLYSNWTQIPEVFPIHWKADGTPNGWAHRTFFGVFGMLVIGALGSLLTGILASVIMLGTRNVSGTPEVAAKDRAFKRATYFFILAISYLTSLTFAIVSTGPVWAPNIQGKPYLFLPVLLLFPLVILCTVYLVRVSRARRGVMGDGTPDACWKWGGLIYYNPDDPALLVEKRMGLGWTFNFANRWSWVVMGVILLPPFAIMAVAGLATR